MIQWDTWNCGILAYRWIEQRVCNSVITYTSVDVAYLRALLQVELLRGKPVRLIAPGNDSTHQLVEEARLGLRRCSDRLTDDSASAEWQLNSPQDSTVRLEHNSPQVSDSTQTRCHG